MGWKWNKVNKLSYLTVPSWEREGISIGFSSRLGGKSQKPYNSLNLGLHVGDSKVDVLNNRKEFLSLFDCSLKDCIIGEQVHGVKVENVTIEDCGKGAFDSDTALSETDGMLTTEHNVGLMSFFADCV
ncbi:MAG: laccase domain-containing protein, partial [Eubacteriales bacterium]